MLEGDSDRERVRRVEPDDTVMRFRLDGGRYVEYASVALLAGDGPDLR